jgi:hypothetical protein
MTTRTPFFLAVLFAITTVPLTAQTGTWTMVGSAGSLDSTSVGIGAFNGIDFQYGGTSLMPIVAYYNVTNTYGGGLTDTPPWKTLELTYIDSSPSASVTATLIEADPCTGALRVLCTIPSVDRPGSSCQSCDFAGPLDFKNHLYFVTVRMTRTAAAATPVARALRIF